MINNSLRNKSAVSVIFHHYMLQNRRSILIMQYDVTRCIICISNNYKVKYLDQDPSYKNSRKEVIL